jgi:hypothetical protein
MKWYGKIGFIVTEETSPGIWDDIAVERNYYGEMNKVSRRWERGNDLNDDISISNELSIVTDPYILENLTNIKYVIYMNVKWKITNISVEHPRLTLSLGGIYNGHTS